MSCRYFIGYCFMFNATYWNTVCVARQSERSPDLFCAPRRPFCGASLAPEGLVPPPARHCASWAFELVGITAWSVLGECACTNVYSDKRGYFTNHGFNITPVFVTEREYSLQFNVHKCKTVLSLKHIYNQIFRNIKLYLIPYSYKRYMAMWFIC